jgi:uncharacterized protein (TIGR03118 family)
MPAIHRRAHPDHEASRFRGWSLRWLAAVVAVAFAALLLVGTAVSSAGTRATGNAFVQRNLVSDIPGVARITDPNLVNPWGLAAGPRTPVWVADNARDVSTLYSGSVDGSIPRIQPLVVRIPGGAPTGIVFNPTTGFVVRSGAASAPAAFIFDSEAGQITAWSPRVPPMTTAQTAVTVPTAVFKGLAITVTGATGPRIYAADFHNARVLVFDNAFAPVRTTGGFVDPNLPAGFAPFNIQELRGRLYVTYARQDARATNQVRGAGLGFVDVFNTNGRLLRRVVSQGALNAPWGLAIAPRGFGRFRGNLLVGNFGDGRINAYRLPGGQFRGTLRNTDGSPIAIDGLWALRFGNGVFGTPDRLNFTAGLADETHGLLGEIATR